MESMTRKESTPPLTIAKMGPYTVFVSSPATQFHQHFTLVSPPPSSSNTTLPSPPPPVQPPPHQFQNHSPSERSTAFDLFWNAVARVQKAHSSLDECMAHWLGLNQSKYQWALDDYDYCQSKGMVNAKAKDIS